MNHLRKLVNLVLVIIGAQHGDEAKGAEVDSLGTDADLVYRFGGGDNAGHTIELDTLEGKKALSLHLLPSVVRSPKPKIALGAGTVVNPIALWREVTLVELLGLSVIKRLMVDVRCTAVMPWHLIYDLAEEIVRERNDEAIGTTGSGMGPAHGDVTTRCDIRWYHLMGNETELTVLLKKRVAAYQKKLDALGINNSSDWAKITRKLTEKTLRSNTALLEANLMTKEECDWNRFLNTSVGRLNAEALVEYILKHVRILKDWGIAGDVSTLINQGLRRGWRIVAEGSQGDRLDNMYGDGKNCTPGRTIAGAAASGAGISPLAIGAVRLVAKMVPSRVGNGPFPTRITDEAIINIMQGDGSKIDDERGRTTGRPRDIGFLDLVILRASCAKNGATCLTLTKLDKVTDATLTRVAIGYRINGKVYSSYPSDPLLAEDPSLELITVDFIPWEEDVSGITQWDELPAAAKEFVLKIEELINDDQNLPWPIVIDRIRTGPGPNDVIIRET